MAFEEVDAVVIGSGMGGLAARNVLSSMPSPVQRMGFPVVERLFPAAYRSSRDEIDRSVTDPRLRAILQARRGLYGTPPATSAFGYHAAVPTTFFMAGTAHPVGGGRDRRRDPADQQDPVGAARR